MFGGLLACIQQPNGLSVMSAVFDDGDEKTLRRSSLCLKGARHFAESEVSIVLSIFLMLYFHAGYIPPFLTDGIA